MGGVKRKTERHVTKRIIMERTSKEIKEQK
jgi:hypothetical protein